MTNRILTCLAIISLSIVSCRKDDATTTAAEVSIETQNTYDDAAIKKFLDDNYLDARGNIKAFSSTDTSDDGYTKLSAMNPFTLPSGVTYIIRADAQPTNGGTLAANDALKLMHNTMTYVATKDDAGTIKFTSGYAFRNTIATGYLEFDPAYYYVKNSALNKYNKDNNVSYTRSFYEIEGFQEAIKTFQSFNLGDSENYNLQGVIIVPSRAAFARDPHFNYTGYSLKDRSLVFNFQIYNKQDRSTVGD